MSDPDVADSDRPPPDGVDAALYTLSSLSPSTLLHDTTVSSSISTLLRHNPSSGSGDNPLCRWLYDTFQSSSPSLQLVALSYIPLLSSLYLTRVTSTRHLTSGFEAVLLSLYSHQTALRPDRTSLSVTVPKLSNPSLYHHPLSPSTAPATDLHVGVHSHALEPHSTLRAASRPRVVGVALEVYYSFIGSMPIRSKLEFCEACEEMQTWELLQPALRILGHCLMVGGDELLHGKARAACKSLYARAVRGIDSKAVLATQSLIRMVDLHQIEMDNEVDYTDLPITPVIEI